LSTGSSKNEVFDRHAGYPHITGVRKAWETAKREAGVQDLRIKDLHRTGATRLLRGGMPIEQISRILGHTTIEMTYEYIGVDKDTTGPANDILDAMHLEHESAESASVN
jgi:integrase